MIRLRRYIEVRNDGISTGRALYYVRGVMPAAADSCFWRADEHFKIDDDTTHDPGKLRYYGAALTQGFVIVDL